MARKIDNETFYKNSLEIHKNDVQALRWNSVESQQKRFSILYKLLPSELNDCSVVDAGCGFGDFFLYLKTKKSLPSSYIGIDMMPEMVAEAKQKTGQNIVMGDILNETLPEADYYICSGAMNILTSFEAHLFIKKCLDASKEAFIFNMLKGVDDSMIYNYFLPQQIKKIAKKYNCEIEIIEGYMPRDFSVKMSKIEPRKVLFSVEEISI